MRTILVLVISLFCLGAGLYAGSPPDGEYAKYWPQWRGPHNTGIAPEANPPLEWSEQKNIGWKVELPGSGHATPIIWNKLIFVLTAIPVEGEDTTSGEPQDGGRRRRGNQPSSPLQFTLLAINRKDGSVAWQRTPKEAVPHEGTHNTATWASGSAVTDGEHLFAYFGSQGLYCYTMDGKLVWQTDLGDMTTRNSFGEGSSPALHDDTIVINWDHEGESFIVAMNKHTGKELWRAERDERTSWATPLVVSVNGQPQVITSATNLVRSYDLKTGDLIWQSSGMTANAIPSPIFANELVYVTSGFRGSAMQAIRLADAQGDVTQSNALVWQYDQDTPYVPSPLVYDDQIYFVKVNTAILSCLNAKTGEVIYNEKRLEGIDGVYASIVGANDRVYIVGRNGASQVIKHGPNFEVLATNILDDGFDASPAMIGNELYLRGRQFLYQILAE